MKFSLFKQTESRIGLDNTPRTEKSCGQKRDAQRTLADVLIHLYQYTEQSRPAQPATGATHFARDTVSCCPRRHWKWKSISVLSLEKSRDRTPKEFWKLTTYFF